jgi:hypothetical protein
VLSYTPQKINYQSELLPNLKRRIPNYTAALSVPYDVYYKRTRNIRKRCMIAQLREFVAETKGQQICDWELCSLTIK